MSSAKVPHERAPWHWGCPASGVDANRPCCRGRPLHARPLQGTGTRGAADAGRRRRGAWELGARVGGRQGPCVQVVGSSPEAAQAGRGAEEQKGWRSRPSRPRGQTCLSVTSPRWKSPARGCFSGGGHGGPSFSPRGRDGAVAGRNRWPGGPGVTLTTSRAGGFPGQRPLPVPREARALPAAPSRQPRSHGRASVSWWQTWMDPVLGGGTSCRGQGLGPGGAQAGCGAGQPWVRAGSTGWAHGSTQQGFLKFSEVEPCQSHEELKCES